MARFGLVTAALLGVLLLAPPAATGQTVLLVSLDGFRPDYLERGLTPTLSALAAGGVVAAMRPAFPSLTFPNHYTLVTGLTPDHHGIVDNAMEDTRLGRFTLGDRAANADRAWWDAGTPVWVSVERAGARAAILFWPGSEADIQGVRPSRYLPYDGAMPEAARVDQLLAWLDLPEAARPRFLTLYFERIDTVGHHDGPQSPALDQALGEIDAALARLMAGLAARGLAEQIDLLIVADHGMSALSSDRVLFIDDYVAPQSVHIVTGGGALMGLAPMPGAAAVVEAALLAPRPHLTCRRKEDMPARLHYGHNPRIPPILCLADPGWVVTTHAQAAKAKAPYLGGHGFDNDAPDMRALFIAHGPDFRAGLRHGDFDNVDVYPLMMRLLGLAPEPHDGSLEPIADMLVTR